MEKDLLHTITEMGEEIEDLRNMVGALALLSISTLGMFDEKDTKPIIKRFNDALSEIAGQDASEIAETFSDLASNEPKRRGTSH
jgi:hypothetical protein